jgi:C1A family cysteine protease
MSLIEATFMQHVADFGLSYGTLEEFNFRQEIFAVTDSKLNELNAKNGTSRVGHNFLSTWTRAERKKLLGYLDVGVTGAKIANNPTANEDSVNWVTVGAVTPVKNQEQCGSCWSFSATGAIEGAHFISTGNLESYSEEELVQCSRLNHGCNGGSMALAFQFVEKHGLNTEANYPYTSGQGVTGSCDKSLETGDLNVTTFTQVPSQRPQELKDAIAINPVSVAIEADETAFQHYIGGVLTEDCGYKLDHGVLAVGYGTEDGVEYFLVKNSWGPTWGDHGYIKLGVTEGPGVCGINMQPVYPATN